VSKGRGPGFVPGDLVRVRYMIADEADFIAIVGDGEALPLGTSPWTAGRVPVRKANRLGRVIWVMPKRLELVQRGEQ